MIRRITLDLPEESVTCINRTVEALRKSGKPATFDQVAATLLIAGSHIVVNEIDEEERAARTDRVAPPREKTIGEMTEREFHACLQARYNGQNVEAEREKMSAAMRDAFRAVERIQQVSGPHMMDRPEWERFKSSVEHQFSHCPAHKLALLVAWTDEHNVMTGSHPPDPGAN